ncbi:transcriptional regulator of sugar metabolism [Pseudarthrobacter phenanthrenivorans Sphe3]|uniref:Transcriptional regulator of sugar metabolism n=1 Tax=Pseudarthrobacter phenanthrenivorans (strain DSM 18606 / JCM 16027 / LMG 23796 / Sphe3) TaxID=930171 RepID=F0M3D1_PSEPM|nr:DeoR/GlpR family DNA-binding transcription regulator [Pseudarthrobacter phenanthrenivorans]ADX74406.1 transcriptional regulator of sugar metabolism [Pseudarthrobacter phenanthrenivorans Sphe3]
MLAVARHQAILDALQRERVVRVSDLAQQLGVSLMTVRRDIEVLEEGGRLERIHGGAKIPGDTSTHEPGFDLKSTQLTAEKQAIAVEAASLVQEGMAVGLSAGTTTWALAKELVNGPQITVVTNSVRIADLFHHAAATGPARYSSTVILIGGERTPSDALVGPIATAALKQLHLDVLFMGVHGMDGQAGFTTPNLLEAETDRAFVAAARKTVVLADHTKWGLLGISSIASLEDVDEVITDSGLGLEAQRLISESTKLRVVPA